MITAKEYIHTKFNIPITDEGNYMITAICVWCGIPTWTDISAKGAEFVIERLDEYFKINKTLFKAH